MTEQEKPAIEQKVKNALAQIRPYLQQDGGDVEYVDMTAEGVVIVRLQGHCGSCPTPCRPSSRASSRLSSE